MNGSLGDRRYESAVLLDFLQPAAPIKFSLVDGDVGTAVAHAHPAIRQEVHGLDDGEVLQVDPAKPGRRVQKEFKKGFAHGLVAPAQEQEGGPSGAKQGGRGVTQPGADMLVVPGLDEFHELGAGVTEGPFFVGDPGGQGPFHVVGLDGSVQVTGRLVGRVRFPDLGHDIVGLEIFFPPHLVGM